ncbi:MAG: hypothetical protein RL021_1064 [Bacteroidota bacterium]|jgi:hypothetical protein
MTDYIIAFLVAFFLLGFVRRFFYFQAYQSFTKAESDFRNRQVPRKPEGTVTLDKTPSAAAYEDDAEDAEWEELR